MSPPRSICACRRSDSIPKPSRARPARNRRTAMVAIMKNVGGRRLRESYGRYYEDFEIGDIYEHRPGRTISEADNNWFTLPTMHQHPVHFDAAYAANSEFKRPLVNSCL